MDVPRIRLGENDLVYFLHIPRTGGTTLYEMLATKFPPAARRKGGDRLVLANDLRQARPEAIGRYRLMSGHYDTNVTSLLNRVPHFVTMLREPIERTKSAYEIIKKMPRHALHRAVVDGGMTFLQYLRHPEGARPDADRQVRQIAGAMDGTPRGPRGRIEGWGLLELARERLEEFAFFGLCERYADSARLLARTFGWEPFDHVPHLNPTPAENHRLRLPARELEVAQELNRLDLELWEHARELFRGRLAALDRGSRPAQALPG